MRHLTKGNKRNSENKNNHNDITNKRIFNFSALRNVIKTKEFRSLFETNIMWIMGISLPLQHLSFTGSFSLFEKIWINKMICFSTVMLQKYECQHNLCINVFENYQINLFHFLNANFKHHLLLQFYIHFYYHLTINPSSKQKSHNIPPPHTVDQFVHNFADCATSYSFFHLLKHIPCSSITVNVIFIIF